jgi:hypothetical protein
MDEGQQSDLLTIDREERCDPLLVDTTATAPKALGGQSPGYEASLRLLSRLESPKKHAHWRKRAAPRTPELRRARATP